MKKRLWKYSKRILYVCAGYIALVYLTILLSPEIRMNADELPNSIAQNEHGDYKLWGTHWIPRTLTSMHFVEPPYVLVSNQADPTKPVPEKGAWQLTAVQVKKGWPLFLPYFAFTSASGIHFRAGCRYDDVDHYYTFPSIALKKI